MDIRVDQLQGDPVIGGVVLEQGQRLRTGTCAGMLGAPRSLSSIAIRDAVPGGPAGPELVSSGEPVTSTHCFPRIEIGGAGHVFTFRDNLRKLAGQRI